MYTYNVANTWMCPLDATNINCNAKDPWCYCDN